MGKPSAQPSSQPEPTIQHFSHAHPLQLSNYQPKQTLNLASCSGCKLKASGWMYSCQMCSYFLHVNCSQMPQQIKHQFDQNHVLSLLPTPIYPQGFFHCDACGSQGNGFSYHCNACSIDLHLLCASKPLSLTHHSHPHQLNLIFSPPYPNQTFSCDICKNTGTNHWLYRCSLCEFDAHLSCATTTTATATTNPNPNPIVAPPVPVQVQPNKMQQQFQTRLIAPAVQAAPIQPVQMQQYQLTSTASVQHPVQAPVQPVQMQRYHPTSTTPVQPVQIQQYQPTSTAPVQPPIQAPVQSIQVQQYQPTSIAPVQRPIQAPVQPIQMPQYQPAPTFGTQYAMRPPYMQSYPPNNMVSAGNPGMYGSAAPGVTGQNNGMMNTVVQGLVGGAAQGAGQELFKGLTGGGGNSGGSGASHLHRSTGNGNGDGNNGGGQDVYGGDGSGHDAYGDNYGDNDAGHDDYGDNGGSHDVYGDNGGHDVYADNSGGHDAYGDNDGAYGGSHDVYGDNGGGHDVYGDNGGAYDGCNGVDVGGTGDCQDYSTY